MLQFDGHGNDAGYMTRCEAYLDSKGILAMLRKNNGAVVNPLTGKTIYIPPMAYGSGRCFAAGFRALGLNADITPKSDARTLELGGRYTSGDECYPAKVTVGDFLRVLEDKATDPADVVFFMPTADGPCRFGQYSQFLRQILDGNGYGMVQVLSPSSRTGYSELGDLATPFLRIGWRMLVVGDVLAKMLLILRPHEIYKGDTDKVYEACLDDVCQTVEHASIEPGEQLKALCDAMSRCRQRFHGVAALRDPDTPLVGVVGEIFCRLNAFSNEDMVRHLEDYGAECWLSDLTEWIWYANSEQFRKLKLDGNRISKEGLSAWIRNRVQRNDEHALLEPFLADLAGYREPTTAEVLELAHPYLPCEGALGEMVLSVGKAVYLAKNGADGIIDISPFTCMNGIVCESIYPRLSRDLGGIPIRTFYFDGTQSDLDRDLGVYMELVHSYQRKKKYSRQRPVFPQAAPARQSVAAGR